MQVIDVSQMYVQDACNAVNAHNELNASKTKAPKQV